MSDTTYPALMTGVSYVNLKGNVKAALVIATPLTITPGTSLAQAYPADHILVTVFSPTGAIVNRVLLSQDQVQVKVAQAQVEVLSQDTFQAASAQEILDAHLVDGALVNYWTAV